MIDFVIDQSSVKKIIKLKKFVNFPIGHINSEPSDLRFYNDWYKHNKKFYYFKRRYIFEELFMKELASEFGLNCVDFFWFVMNQKE